MPADRLHLVRHGEVHNPDGVLYGRLEGFRLSERGRAMAARSADALLGQGTSVSRLYASPLQRAQESAAPWAERTGLEIRTEPRIIEPTNVFEGKAFGFGPGLLKHPAHWRHVLNPWKPSWGEAYTDIAQRMLAAMTDAWDEADGGDVVMVSHQQPIWMAHRLIAGERFIHDPRKRRCALSSITSFERPGGRFAEIRYQDPNADSGDTPIDRGAV